MATYGVQDGVGEGCIAIGVDDFYFRGRPYIVPMEAIVEPYFIRYSKSVIHMRPPYSTYKLPFPSGKVSPWCNAEL